MNDKAIADLRADSLGGVLAAARRRRMRRRAIVILGSGAALAVIYILLVRARSPEPRSIQVSAMNVAPAQEIHSHPEPPYIVRTTARSLVRISTTSKASVRLKTSRTADVRRIDTPSLADFFPGKGIAVIHGDSEPPRAVFF